MYVSANSSQAMTVFLCPGMQAKWYQRMYLFYPKGKDFNNEEFALFVYSQNVTCFFLVYTDAL